MGDRHCNGGTLVLHTTKRALPRSAVPSWLLVPQRLRDIFCMPALFWLCPRLFRGVTPFRRAGGAHVVPETLGLHIPVVRIAHGTSREPSGLLTLHVPYNGREYCRSQLEAHSFSYKPIPTGKKGNALPCCVLFILVRKFRHVPTSRR